MKKNINNLLLAIGVSLACIILLPTLGAFVSGASTPSSPKINTPYPSIIPPTVIPSTPTARVPSPSCSQIQKETEGMTDVQWEKYKDEIEGKWIDGWSGSVTEVSEKGFLTGDDYPVHLETSDGCEVIIYVSDESFAISLNKGDILIVSGEISMLAEFFSKLIYIYEPESVEKQ